ncbi:2-keto-4-pentenoate hydratase [Sphingopyxis sp.]|uniref:2-keto-4-pentenoate hydratase n=1 Tax=Sphingopyxis sp. TaxID=1908224 RepID=UPI003BACD4CE
MNIAAIAERLDTAMRDAHAVPQLAEPLSLDQAYAVQAASLARRYARGERRVGVKMGFTSLAKMEQMGIGEVIWGRLTDAMQVADGGTVPFTRFVHPRIEPEIAFLLGTDLAAEVSEAEAYAALAGVAPALELIDSRYENFRFSLSDVVADNSSSSAFVVGPWSAPFPDLANLNFTMSIGGETKQTGSSAAILGDPIRSLVRAARLAATSGEPLKAGDIVMAGGATAAEALAPGDRTTLDVERLGRVILSAS